MLTGMTDIDPTGAEAAPDTDEDPGDDLAAELDEEPDPAVLDAPEPDDDPAAIYTGKALGGPWDGREVESRFPKGFLLVDMPTRRVWLYDRQDDGSFHARSDKAETLNDDGEFNRWRAAEEDNYDIQVLDEDTSDAPDAQVPS